MKRGRKPKQEAVEMFCTECQVLRDPSRHTKTEFIHAHPGHKLEWKPK